tara:strand:+ start:528 stop:1460 length:933 start_codon:yes stop_codon:yes gene_type:complete
MKTKLLFILFSLTVWFSFSQIPNYLPQNGLVAWYPFNNNYNDESGNGNDGSSSGTITFIDDRESNSLSSVQLGSGSVLLPQVVFPYTREETFSISFWFTHSSTSNARLMSTECPEGNFRITNNSSVSGGFSIQYGDYQNLSLSSPTEWNHVAYVYNSRNEEVYLNGVLEVTNYDSVTQAISYCHPLTLGAKASNINNDRWNGEIDDIGFWNRPLTSQEVSQLYSGNTLGTNIFVNSDSEFKLVPNPTIGVFKIESKTPITKVEIYSISGKKVNEVDSGFETISTDNLFNGMYILRIHSKNGISHKKLIKN